MTHFAALARKLLRWSKALGALGLAVALHTIPAQADDPSFRPFPQHDVLSPRELAARVATLQASALLSPEQRELVEQLTEEIIKDPPPDGSSPTLESLPPWARDVIKDLRPFTNDGTRNTDQQQSPQNSEAAPGPRPKERPEEEPIPQPSATPLPDRAREPAAARDDPSPPRPEPRRQTPSESPPLSDQRRPTTPAEPATSDDPAEPADSTSPPFRWRPTPAPSSEGRPARQTPFRPSPPTNVQPPASDRREPRPSTPSRSPLQTQREFDTQFNKILLDAAQRALRPESAEGSPDVAGSRESFLNPLLRRMQELVGQQQSERWRHRSWTRHRSRRGGPDWNMVERFDMPNLSLPATPAVDMSAPEGGYLSLLAAPAAVGLAVLLAVPLWRRYRGRIAAWLGGAAPAFDLTGRSVRRPEDLVQALDRFLIARFGGRATWWHCRAVERALTELAPEARDDVARLVATYELARYGPRSRPVAPHQLEQATATLRRLAEAHLAKRGPTWQAAPA